MDGEGSFTFPARVGEEGWPEPKPPLSRFFLVYWRGAQQTFLALRACPSWLLMPILALVPASGYHLVQLVPRDLR